MEGFTASTYKGIQGYWRKRGYDRLKSGGGRRKKASAVQLGSDGQDRTPRRRFWRIKTNRRLRLKLRFSPRKLLIGLRDAYVNLMLKLANSRMVTSGYGGDAGAAFGGRRIKEYDEKMLVQIYRSMLVTHGHLVHLEAAAVGSEIAIRR